MKMNNLSIALYAIDVINNINGVVTFCSVAGGIGLATAFFAKFMTSDRELRCEVSINNSANAIIKTLIPVVMVSTLLGIVIPDKKTVRLIVASEFSEAIYKSEDVQEIVNPAKKALKKWLEEYTKEIK